jgi:hypothetical protein
VPYQNALYVESIKTGVTLLKASNTFYIAIGDFAKFVGISVSISDNTYNLDTKTFPNPTKFNEAYAEEAALYSLLAYEDIAYSSESKSFYWSEAEDQSPKLLNQHLKKNGYEAVTNGYYTETLETSVGYTIAYKNKTNADTIVTVVLRGTSGIEWKGNMNVGTGVPRHENFEAANQTIKKILSKYLSDNASEFKTNIHFLITGHSRGAAVSNLLSVDLSRRTYRPTNKIKNVYAFNFAVPGNATSIYNLKNVFNFNFSDDVITKIPPKEWGLSISGVSYSAVSTEVYLADTAVTNAVDTYQKLSGSLGPTIMLGEGNAELITGALLAMAASTEAYNKVDPTLPAAFGSPYLFMSNMIASAMDSSTSSDVLDLLTLISALPVKYQNVARSLLMQRVSISNTHTMFTYYTVLKNGGFKK